MDYIIIALDLIGMIGFLVAAYYGFRNFNSTIAISDVWLIYSIGMLFAAAWVFTLVALQFDVNAEALKQVGQSILTAAIAVFFCFAILFSRGYVKPE